MVAEDLFAGPAGDGVERARTQLTPYGLRAVQWRGNDLCCFARERVNRDNKRQTA
jgi:hypothetical protein